MVAFFRDVASLGSIELISVDSGCIPPLKWTCGETNWFSCSKPPEVIDLMLSDLVFPQWNEDDRLVNKLKKQVFALVVLEGYGSAVRQPVKWSLMPHSVGFEGGWPFAKVTEGKLGELWWLSYYQLLWISSMFFFTIASFGIGLTGASTGVFPLTVLIWHSVLGVRQSM